MNAQAKSRHTATFRWHFRDVTELKQAEAARVAAVMRRHASELIDLVRTQALGQAAVESLGSLSIVLVVIVGGFQVMAERLTWPSLLAFLMAVRAAHGRVAVRDFLEAQNAYVASLKPKPTTRKKK